MRLPLSRLQYIANHKRLLKIHTHRLLQNTTPTLQLQYISSTSTHRPPLFPGTVIHLRMAHPIHLLVLQVYMHLAWNHLCLSMTRRMIGRKRLLGPAFLIPTTELRLPEFTLTRRPLSMDIPPVA